LNYYHIAIIGSPLAPLTYQSEKKIPTGRVVEVKLRSRLVQGIIYLQCEKPKFTCEKIENILDFSFDDRYIKIIKFLSQYYSSSYGDAAKLFIPFHLITPKEVNSFGYANAKFSLAECPRTDEPCLKSDKLQSIKTSIKLSSEQQKAYDFILENQTSLLFGDTGSGKTEIYMKLFEKMINSGKSSIFLMPEISLTPQMRKRLKEHFGDMVAIWHSKVTKKAKEKILDGINRGEIKIVAGARSSLFLPLPNIGLIVVDEEHDDSYKASNRPRYHARDTAIYMGQVLGAKVLLGSATPSLTSYHKFPHFRLKGTFFEGSKDIEFLDDSDQINDRVYEELHKVLKSDNQAIIFLPTRANYKYLTCFECGKFVECPFCSVGMSIHLAKNALRCHYCNYIQRLPNRCPSCKSESLRSSRIGTAQVTAELTEMFQDKVILKFDRDEITTESKLKKALKAFNDKEIDMLVGTQMISKGHDYHDVKLVVVLGIDTILAQADFRARERALSLLLQVAGRAGRKGEGRVLIQTANREFFQHYLKDYEQFLKDELSYRKDLYPPFKKLMKFLVSHKDRYKAKETLEKLQLILENAEDIEVVGFGEAPINKIANKFRYQVLLRSNSPKALLKVAKSCKIANVEIDIDPVSFS
jgi:primosomal protein N' (replication factor Y)